MRKLLTILLAFGVIAGVGLPSPASAGHREDIKGSFEATGVPFPYLWVVYLVTDPGCGIEGVNYTAEPFEAPGKGTLVVRMEGFVGDWDIAIVDERDRVFAGSWNGSYVTGEEEAAVILLRGEKVKMLACNYLGAPQAEVTYEFLFAR